MSLVHNAILMAVLAPQLPHREAVNKATLLQLVESHAPRVRRESIRILLEMALAFLVLQDTQLLEVPQWQQRLQTSVTHAGFSIGPRSAQQRKAIQDALPAESLLLSVGLVQ